MSNLIVVILMAVALIVLSVSGALETRNASASKGALSKRQTALEKHVKTLVEQRTQLAKDNWSEAIRLFIIDHVRPLLSREELVVFHRTLQPLL